MWIFLLFFSFARFMRINDWIDNHTEIENIVRSSETRFALYEKIFFSYSNPLISISSISIKAYQLIWCKRRENSITFVLRQKVGSLFFFLCFSFLFFLYRINFFSDPWHFLHFLHSDLQVCKILPNGELLKGDLSPQKRMFEMQCIDNW